MKSVEKKMGFNPNPKKKVITKYRDVDYDKLEKKFEEIRRLNESSTNFSIPDPSRMYSRFDI